MRDLSLRCERVFRSNEDSEIEGPEIETDDDELPEALVNLSNQVDATLDILEKMHEKIKDFNTVQVQQLHVMEEEIKGKTKDVEDLEEELRTVKGENEELKNNSVQLAARNQEKDRETKATNQEKNRETKARVTTLAEKLKQKNYEINQSFNKPSS